jgi:spore coat polysaccharide biosynthesis protein SpsF
MSSTRLPGKALLPLAGKPVLAHMIERHRRSRYTDEVVVAAPDNEADEPIAALCKKMSCAIFRGNEQDVFSRVVSAARQYGADIVVDGMADTPLVDHRIVDKLIELLVEGPYDCTSNEFEETYPVGLDARVFDFAALEKSEANDREAMYREHAGYSIRSRPEKYKLGNLKGEGKLSWPALRLTLDTKEDYALISAVYDALYPENQDFSADDIVTFLKAHPELVALNSGIQQKTP